MFIDVLLSLQCHIGNLHNSFKITQHFTDLLDSDLYLSLNDPLSLLINEQGNIDEKCGCSLNGYQ